LFKLRPLDLFSGSISALDFGEYKDPEPEIAADGPIINAAMSPDVIGVLGKDVRLACHVTNLGNKTVRVPGVNVMVLKYLLRKI
jgi:hypothetical protein